MTFVSLWKWARLFDITTGGMLFRAALGSTGPLFLLGCISTCTFLTAVVTSASFIEFGTCLREPPCKGFSYRVSVLLNILYISVFYSLVLLAVLELYVAFIMVWFCLFLHSFPLWKIQPLCLWL